MAASVSLAPAAQQAPRPRSPPQKPDSRGKHRLQVEVQSLDHQIGALEEELQSLEGIRPVSRCCKEINEYVGTNPDPFVPATKKEQSTCCSWKWLRSKICLNFSWICCCFSGCPCACQIPKSNCCGHCCCRCPCSCKRLSCCAPPCCLCFSCPEYSCGCVWSCHKCTEVCPFPRCTKTCCMC